MFGVLIPFVLIAHKMISKYNPIIADSCSTDSFSLPSFLVIIPSTVETGLGS